MSKRNKNKKKADHQKLGLLDFGSVFLRTVKLLTDFFYIIVILFGMLGVGLALFWWRRADTKRTPVRHIIMPEGIDFLERNG